MRSSPTLSTARHSSRPNEAHAMLTRLRRSHATRSAPGSGMQLSQAPLPWGERILPADAPASKLLLKVEEAAHLLSLSRKTLYDLMRRGELVSLKIGGSRRIPLTGLHDFIARLEEVA